MCHLAGVVLAKEGGGVMSAESLIYDEVLADLGPLPEPAATDFEVLVAQAVMDLLAGRTS